MSANTLTNAIYWASRDPRIQALQQLNNINDGDGKAARYDAAIALAQEGLIIDAQIDGWGIDAAQEMSLRAFYGYTWYPSIIQPPPSVPGHSLPGETPYDPNNPPAGSVKVSTDAADYPPFAPPTPPAPVDLTVEFVGGAFYPGSNVYYGIGNSQAVNNGETITGSKGTFVAQKVTYANPFSRFGSVVVTWTKQ